MDLFGQSLAHHRFIFRSTVALLGLSCLLGLPHDASTFLAAAHPRDLAGEARHLNILFIFTDDQRWDSMCMDRPDDAYSSPCEFDGDPTTVGVQPPMPFMTNLMRRQAVRFQEAFYSYPLCCPVRTSLLSGGLYPQTTRITGNKAPHGGAAKFESVFNGTTHETLATLLQERTSYKTALVGGKYLNEYDLLLAEQPGYIPLAGTTLPPSPPRPTTGSTSLIA